MHREDMDRLIEEHLTAEKAGDPDGSVAMYTPDVIHDVVGSSAGPLHGPDAARGFYEMLTSNIATEQMDVTRAWCGDDFCTVEHQWHGTVPGEFLGIPGRGRRISFRMLHVFEFRQGRISRENVWLDANAILAQLTAAGTRRRETSTGRQSRCSGAAERVSSTTSPRRRTGSRRGAMESTPRRRAAGRWLSRGLSTARPLIR
jgi:steroid delta-isomerase-like uncharacterized protein